MDRRSFLATTGAATAAMLAGGAMPAFAAATGEDARLATLLDEIFYAMMDASPEYATMLGIDTGARAGLRSKLSDYSANSRTSGLARDRAFQKRLAAIDAKQLSPAHALYRDCVDYLVTSQVEGAAQFDFGDNSYSYTPYVISQQNGAFSSVPDFLDSHHPVKDKADAEAYLVRLAGFASALDQNSERQRADAERGVFAPGFALDTTLAQLNALRGKPAAQSVLVTSVARRAREAGLTGDYGARATEIVTKAVYPALDRQIAMLKDLRAKATDEAGVWRLPNGADYYAAAVRTSTTTNMTPEEVHKMGLEQVADISAKLDAVLRAEGLTTGTVGERLNALNKDPAQLFDNDDAGRKALLDSLNGQMAHLDTLLPKVFETLPRAKVQVVRVPELIQDGAPNGYYNSPPLDNSRPGLFYINLKDTHDWPKYGLPSLTYHEASPGHHFQISLSQESKDTPRLLKLSPFGAYVEGWGLYAEQLADEMGAYDEYRIGRAGFLQSLLFRAARLVVDTGIHHKRWSREQATTYMIETTGFPRPRTQREIDRYCVAPGQACSYKVGHTMWDRVRSDAKAKLGDRFDLRAFHQILLKGAMPLTILEREVQAWVATQTA